MPQNVEIPGVGTLQFPDGMSQQDMSAAIQKNYPQLGQAQQPKQAEGLERAGQVGMAALGGVNKGISTLAGIPMDALLNVRDLGKAVLGTGQSLVTGQAPSPALDVKDDRSNEVLSGQWFSKWLNKIGIGTEAPNPNDPLQRYANVAGQAIPAGVAAAAGSPTPLATAATAGASQLAGGVAGQAASDLGLPPEVAMAANLMAQNPKAAVGMVTAPVAIVARKALQTGLESLESRASPRVAGDLKVAQNVAPDQQTVGQTAGPTLAKLGQGAAGSTSTEASAKIADGLADGLIAQAKKIAPVGISNPEAAETVVKTLDGYDTKIQEHANNVYQIGSKTLDAHPDAGTPVQMNNLQKVFNDMQAEIADPQRLGVPELSGRLQQFVNEWLPKTTTTPTPQAPGMGGMGTSAAPPTVQTTGGATWRDMLKVGKEINTLYDNVPRDARTPALDQVFARLKSAYQQDIAASPMGARDGAGNLTPKGVVQKTNEVYGRLQDKRAELDNSVVSQIVGPEGKLAKSDPDQVLNRIAGMKPAAVDYMRTILERRNPDLLDQLRSYAITKAVGDAARSDTGSAVSRTNVFKLDPEALAKSGLFDKAQAAELADRAAALRTARNALPEKASTNTAQDVTPQSVGRLAGGGFNPVFAAGTAANIISRGWLERALNTPEGRNGILGGSGVPSKQAYKSGTSQPDPVDKVRKIWQAAVVAQSTLNNQSDQGVNVSQ